MKVVFTTMFRETKGGGIGRVAHEIAPAFAFKHETLFIYPGWKTILKKRGKLTRLEIQSEEKNEIAIPILSSKNIKKIFEELKSFSPEIIHAQDLGPLSFLIQMWARKNKIPFVYTSHVLPTKIAGFGAQEISGNLGKILENKLAKKYFINFFENCEAVIALNKNAEKDILKFGYTGKIFLIPNGRDLSLYKNKKIKNCQAKANKILLFVGYLTRRKNQKFLIETMKYLPKNYVLKLAGPAIDEKYLVYLRNYCQKYKLNNFEFLGKVPYLDVSKLLLETDIFVSASKMEVQSLAIIEALASGTPVIGLSNETVDELVNIENGFVFSKNASPKEFAKKVKEICSLPREEYLKLSDSAREKVKELDWVKIVNRTAEKYKEIITDKLSHQTYQSKNISFEDFRSVTKFFSKLKINKEPYFNDLNVIILALTTLLASNFCSLFEEANSLIRKIRD